MKFLIPLAVILGIVGAIVTFQRFFPSPQAEETKQNPTLSEPSGSESQSVDDKEDKKQTIFFEYKDSNPILSRPNSPYSTPSEDYKPERATKDGYTVQAKDGIAVVQSDNETIKYIVTDTGRNNHKVAPILGFTSNPYRIYADCDESHENDPYSRLDGLFVGKTISYGYVTQATPTKVIIRRIDGGKTYITFSRSINENKGNKAEGKEELEEPYATEIQPPKVEAPKPQGVYPPEARG
jgi:hypothetical protein